LRDAGLGGCDFVGFVAEALFAEGFGLFVDGELIDLSFAADDGFAEAEIGINEEFGEIAGDRVDGERDSRGIATNHLLNDDGHGGLLVRETVLGAVSDGAIRKKREVAIFDGVENAGFADAVEEGFVLAGESGDGEVFEGG